MVEGREGNSVVEYFPIVCEALGSTLFNPVSELGFFYNLGWLQTCYRAKDGLELGLLLLSPTTIQTLGLQVCLTVTGQPAMLRRQKSA